MARERIEMNIAADSLHRQRAYLKNVTQIPSFSGNADVQLATFPKLSSVKTTSNKIIHACECFQYNIVFELDTSNIIHCNAYRHDGYLVKEDIIPSQNWDFSRPLASEFIGEYGSMVSTKAETSSGSRNNLAFGQVSQLSAANTEGFPEGSWSEYDGYDAIPEFTPTDENATVTVTRSILRMCWCWCSGQQKFIETFTYSFDVRWSVWSTVLVNAEPSGYWILLNRNKEMFVIDAGDRYTPGQNLDRVWHTQTLKIGDKEYPIEIMDDYIPSKKEYKIFTNDSGSELYLYEGGIAHPFRSRDPGFPVGTLPSLDVLRAKKAAAKAKAKEVALAAVKEVALAAAKAAAAAGK